MFRATISEAHLLAVSDREVPGHTLLPIAHKIAYMSQFANKFRQYSQYALYSGGLTCENPFARKPHPYREGEVLPPSSAFYQKDG